MKILNLCDEIMKFQSMYTITESLLKALSHIFYYNDENQIKTIDYDRGKIVIYQ